MDPNFVFFNFYIFTTFLLSQLHKFQKKHCQIFMLVCFSIDRPPSHFCARFLTFLWRNIESWWSEENCVIWGHLAKAKYISKFFSCQGLNSFLGNSNLIYWKACFQFQGWIYHNENNSQDITSISSTYRWENMH